MVENTNKWVIFDLDGTLADIEIRRKMAINSKGKMDWDIFFAPALVAEDDPNIPVIMMAQALAEIGYMVAIFSGRSERTKNTTKSWLNKHKVPWHILKMRPEKHPFKFMPDEKLKLQWLNEMDWKDDVVAVFDDRDKVVKMWRDNGLTCMQVAPGNF
jgi:FMN phosphatase YigB (HAD superfamily)